MSYRTALESAGAKVLAFDTFGSYQGDWAALVEYKGERGWVQGAFGSCSHCDAFDAEFGDPSLDGDEYDARLKSFGESYLGGLLSTEKVHKHFEDYAEYDIESEIAAEWVLHTAKKFGVEE